MISQKIALLNFWYFLSLGAFQSPVRLNLALDPTYIVGGKQSSWSMRSLNGKVLR
ncbi:hypothetical protein GcC1_c13352o30 [Golovinomyces cichoracearum]|uniref:Uncharacterized protein n=1 Tax=Golovinomyces cichoracearum TaxID=62708 RepID=A0A420J3A0_9PEZI|nr:hypothetical protein GcC1_c13352o30 [Golovinomyces cichoracearum]